jgi:hypothetical protein
MKQAKNLLTVMWMFPALFFAQAENQFNGINLKESLETVQGKLSSIVSGSELIQVDEPVFPLAKETEQHLICTDIKTETGAISRAVFTFSDDQLTYIQALGNVEKSLVTKLADTAIQYIGYDVYQKQKLFINKEKDAAWIMTDEAWHPHLFVWENPHLKTGVNEEELTNTGRVPSFLKMGATFDELQASMEANSTFTIREELDGSDPNAQYQINCFGVNYLGFPRKVEARFGDDILKVVWILTGKGEEDRVRQALLAQYGPPVFTDENWEIYNDWQVGLRKDKPEVLLMEQKLGQVYKKEYFKQ